MSKTYRIVRPAPNSFTIKCPVCGSPMPHTMIVCPSCKKLDEQGRSCLHQYCSPIMVRERHEPIGWMCDSCGETRMLP